MILSFLFIGCHLAVYVSLENKTDRRWVNIFAVCRSYKFPIYIEKTNQIFSSKMVGSCSSRLPEDQSKMFLFCPSGCTIVITRPFIYHTLISTVTSQRRPLLIQMMKNKHIIVLLSHVHLFQILDIIYSHLLTTQAKSLKYQ